MPTSAVANLKTALLPLATPRKRIRAHKPATKHEGQGYRQICHVVGQRFTDAADLYAPRIQRRYIDTIASGALRYYET